MADDDDIARYAAAIKDLEANGMLPDFETRTKAEIRAKMEDLLKRPTGLNDQLADLYRGRVEGLRWVIGEIDEL